MSHSRWFTRSQRPSKPTCAMPTAACSKVARKRSSLSRRVFSAALSAVWSRNTSTTPVISPCALRMGAPLSAMGYSVPSRAMSTVWLANPITIPSRNTRATGFSTSRRVSSLTMPNTSPMGFPCASASRQPVIFSADGFICQTQPLVSVVMTLSPIL